MCVQITLQGFPFHHAQSYHLFTDVPSHLPFILQNQYVLKLTQTNTFYSDGMTEAISWVYAYKALLKFRD